MDGRKRFSAAIKREEEDSEDEYDDFLQARKLQELQDLIRPLSGEPLSLTILAANAERKRKKIPRFIQSEDTPHLQEARRQELQLFEKYIGPYEDVLEGAFRHVENEYADGEPSERVSDRYRDPEITVAEGPRPDVHVWMGLFLGKEEEELSRQQYRRELENCTGEYYSNIYQVIQRSGFSSIRNMPILEVARNILKYLSEKARTMGTKDLFYFCAVYGLSHVAGHVLEGKYGKVLPSTLTINTPLSIPIKGRFDMPRHLPFLGVVATLGYHHAVQFAVQVLHADIRARLTCDTANRRAVKTMEYFGNVGAYALFWCIFKNQPEMVKMLTSNEVGVQFRWLENGRLMRICQLLFHVQCEGDEYGPVWLPQRRNMGRAYQDECTRNRPKSKKCYREKQKMLSAVIEAGMPRDLLIPSNVDFAALNDDANKLAKSEGLDEPSDKIWETVIQQLTKAQKQTAFFFDEAREEYNEYAKERESLSVVEFQQHVNALFLANDGRPFPNVQKARLEDYDELDPRWRRYAQADGEENFSDWWDDEDEFW